MGKARTDKYGQTREQALIKENRVLKRQVQSLRKTLARIDLDRYDTVKEMIEQHYTDGREKQGKEILENLKKSWRCYKCDDGYLEIFVFNRGQDTIYYRICSNAPACMNRTKPQTYTPSVKGIMRKDQDE
jgi:hypothetical protein